VGENTDEAHVYPPGFNFSCNPLSNGGAANRHHAENYFK